MLVGPFYVYICINPSTSLLWIIKNRYNLSSLTYSINCWTLNYVVHIAVKDMWCLRQYNTSILVRGTVWRQKQRSDNWKVIQDCTYDESFLLLINEGTYMYVFFIFIFYLTGHFTSVINDWLLKLLSLFFIFLLIIIYLYFECLIFADCICKCWFMRNKKAGFTYYYLTSIIDLINYWFEDRHLPM